MLFITVYVVLQKIWGNFKTKIGNFLVDGITEVHRVWNEGQVDTERGKGKKTSYSTSRVLTLICDMNFSFG